MNCPNNNNNNNSGGGGSSSSRCPVPGDKNVIKKEAEEILKMKTSQ